MFPAPAMLLLAVPIVPLAGSAAPLARLDAQPRASAPAIDVAAILEPIRARHDLPGLVAAIVDTRGAVAAGACGVRERGREERLTVDDRMHLGSCTKAMTATVCARLVRAQKLSWTTTIGATFGTSGFPIDPGWRDATLEQLLSHRAGVPREVPPETWTALFASQDAPRAQRDALARAILGRPPAHAPGTKFEYSNAGTTLAGMMAERAAGLDFEELVERDLFAPLGMERAGFGPPGTPNAHDEPRGHRANGKPVGLGIGADNPPAITPAGRVHAPISDWARFAALHLRGPREGGLGLLPEDFARLHATPADGLDDYALGWGTAKRAWGGRVITHSGSNTMWFCVAWLAPEKGFGVLVATNQGGDAAQKAADEAASALIQAHSQRAEAGQ